MSIDKEIIIRSIVRIFNIIPLYIIVYIVIAVIFLNSFEMVYYLWFRIPYAILFFIFTVWVVIIASIQLFVFIKPAIGKENKIIRKEDIDKILSHIDKYTDQKKTKYIELTSYKPLGENRDD